jgi:hypothetical protein
MAAVKNHARENQHTRRRANRSVKENRDDWKAKLKVSHLMNRLSDCGDGRVALEPTQIKAIEILLDRVVPRLSAVEEKQVNEMHLLTREDILGRIQLLLQSDPTLLPELVALQAREVNGAPANVTVVQPGPTKVRG